MKKISNLITRLLIIIILAILCSFLLTKHYSNKIFTPLYHYAESETKKNMAEIINNSLTEEIEKSLDEESLYQIVKNDRGEIELIDFNTTKVNKILLNLTNNIEDKIKNMELEQTNTEIINSIDGLIYNLPLGAVSGNVFLNNIGVKIPLKITLMGDVISEMQTNVTEYGLNNALLKVEIKVTINTRVVAPFTSKEMTLENTIPISIKVIQGTVPGYYIGNTTTTN